jgi:hypothetical protein
MALILSEPMKKVVEIPKILAKSSVKTQNFTQNALTGSAHRPGEKGEKNTQKTSAPFFRRKNCFSEKVLCFCLPWPPPFVLTYPASTIARTH